MSRNLSISETGLKLIKAFEGYRPVDRELVTGVRVVGYGHRLHSDAPVTMNRDEADETLAADLAPYEELVNEEVHAPLSQSQFDALCSLAFNIGPKAFRTSDTLRALNNGRPLDAANGFDVWRKSTINGQTYVVDALMRRRTAEKSLFLRTETVLAAPSALLPPEADDVGALLQTDDGLPVFTEDEPQGLVRKVSIDAAPEAGAEEIIDAETTEETPRRRRDDDPVGILTLSEIIEPDEGDLIETETIALEKPAVEVDDAVGIADDTLVIVEADEAEGEPKLSLIAEAADALGDRLDALIDSEPDRPAEDTTGDWPQSLIKPIETQAPGPEKKPGATSNLLAFPERRRSAPVEYVPANEDRPATPETPVVIDELAADESLVVDRRLPDPELGLATAEDPIEPARSGLWIPVLLGSAVLAASLMAGWLGAEPLLGPWGPIIVAAGTITGALLLMFAIYMMLRRDN